MSYFEIGVLVLLGIIVIQLQFMYMTMWGRGNNNPLRNCELYPSNLYSLTKNFREFTEDFRKNFIEDLNQFFKRRY